MKIEVRPSDVYRNITPGMIKAFLLKEQHRIVDFRMAQTGDTVLFYNNGNLSLGIAKVQYAGFPRFILEPVSPTGVEDFWE